MIEREYEYTPRHGAKKRRDADPDRARRRKKGWVFAALIALTAVLAVSILFLSGVFGDNKQAMRDLQGKWEMEGYTVYEFDGSGSGRMHTDIGSYTFSYRVRGGKLYIDYDDASAEDRSYGYSLSGSTLMLNRGGAEYTLVRSGG